mmetsp:Transcript_119211/g.337977  ORF Transcript_119211/g.337977 Transcript_119211/m.337977 type:complete len:223 (-) Transcript_119211:72-740(-)
MRRCSGSTRPTRATGSSASSRRACPGTSRATSRRGASPSSPSPSPSSRGRAASPPARCTRSLGARSTGCTRPRWTSSRRPTAGTCASSCSSPRTAASPWRMRPARDTAAGSPWRCGGSWPRTATCVRGSPAARLLCPAHGSVFCGRDGEHVRAGAARGLATGGSLPWLWAGRTSFVNTTHWQATRMAKCRGAVRQFSWANHVYRAHVDIDNVGCCFFLPRHH